MTSGNPPIVVPRVAENGRPADAQVELWWTRTDFHFCESSLGKSIRRSPIATTSLCDSRSTKRIRKSADKTMGKFSDLSLVLISCLLWSQVCLSFAVLSWVALMEVGAHSFRYVFTLFFRSKRFHLPHYRIEWPLGHS